MQQQNSRTFNGEMLSDSPLSKVFFEKNTFYPQNEKKLNLDHDLFYVTAANDTFPLKNLIMKPCALADL